MEYYAMLEPAPEGGYVVTFPDVPGAVTEGDTLDEALANAAEALNGVIESRFERGYTLPQSKVRRGKKYHAVEVSPRIAIAWELRHARGKRSQSEVAKKLNISQQAYCKLENPRTCNPTVRTLEKITTILDKRLHIELG